MAKIDKATVAQENARTFGSYRYLVDTLATRPYASRDAAEYTAQRLNCAAGESVWMADWTGRHWIVRRVKAEDFRPVTLADLQAEMMRRQQRQRRRK